MRRASCTMSAKCLISRLYFMDGRGHLYAKWCVQLKKSFGLAIRKSIREGAFQYRWSINVWAGVLKDRVVNILVNYKENSFSSIVFLNVFTIDNF